MKFMTNMRQNYLNLWAAASLLKVLALYKIKKSLHSRKLFEWEMTFSTLDKNFFHGELKSQAFTIYCIVEGLNILAYILYEHQRKFCRD